MAGRISGKWDAVANNIISQLLNCDVGNGRISHRSGSKIVVKIECDRDTFQDCLEPTVSDLHGKVMSWLSVGRKAEGRTWRYTIVFMRDPEEEPFLTDDEKGE